MRRLSDEISSFEGPSALAKEDEKAEINHEHSPPFIISLRMDNAGKVKNDITLHVQEVL